MKIVIQILWMLFYFSPISTPTEENHLIIIVNKNNTLNSISSDELKKIYLGKQTILYNNTLVLISEFSDSKEQFCQLLFKLSAKQYSKYWFELIFSGSTAKSPKMFKSPESMIEFVGEHDGAIGYLPANYVSSNNKIKVLKIDNLNYNDNGYLLLSKQ